MYQYVEFNIAITTIDFEFSIIHWNPLHPNAPISRTQVKKNCNSSFLSNLCYTIASLSRKSEANVYFLQLYTFYLQLLCQIPIHGDLLTWHSVRWITLQLSNASVLCINMWRGFPTVSKWNRKMMVKSII